MSKTTLKKYYNNEKGGKTMNKEQIDKTAEREAAALRRQGKDYNPNYKRTRQQQDYNKNQFNKLFRS